MSNTNKVQAGDSIMAHTPMENAIMLLEKKREELKEMDLSEILLEDEFVHKSNEISSIQIMLSSLLPQERQMVIDAYNQGYRDGENDAANPDVGEKDIDDYDDANNYFINKYKK